MSQIIYRQTITSSDKQQKHDFYLEEVPANFCNTEDNYILPIHISPNMDYEIDNTFISLPYKDRLLWEQILEGRQIKKMTVLAKNNEKQTEELITFDDVNIIKISVNNKVQNMRTQTHRFNPLHIYTYELNPISFKVSGYRDRIFTYAGKIWENNTVLVIASTSAGQNKIYFKEQFVTYVDMPSWKYINTHCSYYTKEKIQDFAKEKGIYTEYSTMFSELLLHVPPHLLEETKKFIFSYISGNSVYIQE